MSRSYVETKPITLMTRFVGTLVIILVFLAGVQLFILSDQTAQYFAWTIAVPLTAASLGAGYWAALIPTIVGIQDRSWANIRITVIIGFTATLLMLMTTLLHLDKFHHTEPVSLAWFAGWVWIVVYLISPFLFLMLLISQWRAKGADPQYNDPFLPPIRVMFGVQAFIGLVVGAALFLMPDTFAPQWAWALTPLTSRAIGTWLIASGVSAAVVIWENDFVRVKGALYGLITFGLLELIAMFRFNSAVNWSNPLAWLYVIFMVSHIVNSGYLVWKYRQKD